MSSDTLSCSNLLFMYSRWGEERRGYNWEPNGSENSDEGKRKRWLRDGRSVRDHPSINPSMEPVVGVRTGSWSSTLTHGSKGIPIWSTCCLNVLWEPRNSRRAWIRCGSRDQIRGVLPWSNENLKVKSFILSTYNV